jgi:hypothetical protein
VWKTGRRLQFSVQIFNWFSRADHAAFRFAQTNAPFERAALTITVATYFKVATDLNEKSDLKFPIAGMHIGCEVTPSSKGML